MAKGGQFSRNLQLDIKSTANRKIIDFRKLAFKDLLLLGRYNYTKAEKKLPEHAHPDMLEICYYNKGRQYFEINEKQYLVSGNEVFLHYPGEKHGSGGHPESKGVLYWLIIRLIPENSNQLVFLCRELIAKNTRHFKATQQVRKILDELFVAHEKKEDIQIKSIRLRILTQSLLLCLLDGIENKAGSTNQLRLEKTKEYIRQNLKENISISLLARQIHLSESRFKSLFKELTGFTPGDYIQREKINLALQMLKEDPTLSVTSLAYEMNFSSPQYFSTVVKKYTGISPSEIRDVRISTSKD